MKVLIVASSSGGHVYPAYNFCKYLKDKVEKCKVLGIRDQIEEKIVPNEDLVLTDFPKSFKRFIKHPIDSYFKIIKDKDIINSYDVVVGFGGFITLIVSILLKREKLFYIHEANVDFGDANYLCLPRANGIFTTFEITKKYKYMNKIHCVGNPTICYLEYEKRNREYISFVFGSLSSETLLERTYNFLLNQSENEKFIIVTSEKYYQKYKNKLMKKTNVTVVPYIEKNELYQKSKLIFCRGGASTLIEVIAEGINCVCIPSPYVKHHHQEHNAKYLFEHHLLVYVNEEEYELIKIKELLNYYKSKYFPRLELKNQTNFLKKYPCLEMLRYIQNDYHKTKL